MKPYRITFVRRSDYCYLQPRDQDCQYTITVHARNKYEAIQKALKGEERSYNRKVYSAIPMIYTVEKLA